MEEKYNIAFDVLLGSAEKAEIVLKRLYQFAAKTPFTIPDVEKNAKTLLAYNISVNDLIPTMTALGNIAAALGKDRFPRLAAALGQVKAATILRGQELRQFTEAGVGLLGILAKQLNKTEAEIQKLVSQRKITFDDVKTALLSTSKVGGKFFNLMDLQSRTLFGLMSNVADFFILLTREILPKMQYRNRLR